MIRETIAWSGVFVIAVGLWWAWPPLAMVFGGLGVIAGAVRLYRAK